MQAFYRTDRDFLISLNILDVSVVSIV